MPEGPTIEYVLPVLIDTAKMICAEQPDVPEPQSLTDLDSFSFVQIILEMENIFEYKILESLETFEGETFEDLALFIARCDPDNAPAAASAEDTTRPEDATGSGDTISSAETTGSGDGTSPAGGAGETETSSSTISAGAEGGTPVQAAGTARTP